METDPSMLSPSAFLRRASMMARSAMRGGASERLLRSLMHQIDPKLRKGLVHLLPQPRHFEPTDARDVVVGGVSFDLFPHEFIQWVHYFGWPDPNFESLLCFAENSRCLIDVGANVGIYSLRVAARSPACRVVSIEAHPNTFERLASNARRNPTLPLELLNVAISAQPGRLTLFEFDGSDSGFSSAVDRPGTAIVGSVQVPAVTLDAVVSERKLEPDLLKIDVEGFEPEVLGGAVDTLARCRPTIVLEWTPQWATGREAMVGRAVDLLSTCGYRAWRTPNFDVPAPRETALSSLLSTTHPQQNLVLSVSDSAPKRLADWFRGSPH